MKPVLKVKSNFNIPIDASVSIKYLALTAPLAPSELGPTIDNSTMFRHTAYPITVDITGQSTSSFWTKSKSPTLLNSRHCARLLDQNVCAAVPKINL